MSEEPVMNKVRMMRPMDWVMIALAGVCLALSVVGIVKADALGARVASAGLGIVAITAVNVLIFGFRLPEYKQKLKAKTTKHGIIVHISPGMASLPLGPIEEWTISCMQHWKKEMGWSLEQQLEVIKGVKVTMLDLEYMSDGSGFKYRGIYYPPKTINIVTIPQEDEGLTPLRLVKSLFRHELSHHIVTKMGDSEQQGLDKQHELFSKTGLGA